MSDKDAAIIELAHVAASLCDALRDAKLLPGILDEAITNKIAYYKSFAEEN